MGNANLDPRSEKAIGLALNARWDEAAGLNLLLLEDYPEDIDTLNRLGRAYSELGNLSKAKACFQKVLKLDPYNTIASNNIKRLSNMKAADIRKVASTTVDPDVFLEEPGKTKVVELEDLAMDSLLATLRTADPVELNVNKDSVTAVSTFGKRVGKLPSEAGGKIAAAAASGGKFTAVVKSVSINKDPSVSIFVREEQRGSKQVTPTFPVESSTFTPYVREEALGILSNQEPVQTEGEETTEEVELKDIPSGDSPASLESIQTKEFADGALYDEEET